MPGPYYSISEKRSLEVPFSKEELDTAIRALARAKTPGGWYGSLNIEELKGLIGHLEAMSAEKNSFFDLINVPLSHKEAWGVIRSLVQILLDEYMYPYPPEINGFIAFKKVDNLIKCLQEFALPPIWVETHFKLSK